MKQEELDIPLKLTEDQLELLMFFLKEMVNRMEDTPPHLLGEKVKYHYSLAKLELQLDVQWHKQVNGACAPGSEGCALLENIKRFKRVFADEIAEEEGIEPNNKT